jgi:hypothetical protein
VLCLGAHGADLEIGYGTIRANAEILDRAVAWASCPSASSAAGKAD